MVQDCGLIPMKAPSTTVEPYAVIYTHRSLCVGAYKQHLERICNVNDTSMLHNVVKSIYHGEAFYKCEHVKKDGRLPHHHYCIRKGQSVSD